MFFYTYSRKQTACCLSTLMDKTFLAPSHRLCSFFKVLTLAEVSFLISVVQVQGYLPCVHSNVCTYVCTQTLVPSPYGLDSGLWLWVPSPGRNVSFSFFFLPACQQIFLFLSLKLSYVFHCCFCCYSYPACLCICIRRSGFNELSLSWWRNLFFIHFWKQF